MDGDRRPRVRGAARARSPNGWPCASASMRRCSTRLGRAPCGTPDFWHGSSRPRVARRRPAARRQGRARLELTRCRGALQPDAQRSAGWPSLQRLALCRCAAGTIALHLILFELPVAHVARLGSAPLCCARFTTRADRCPHPVAGLRADRRAARLLRQPREPRRLRADLGVPAGGPARAHAAGRRRRLLGQGRLRRYIARARVPRRADRPRPRTTRKEDPIAQMADGASSPAIR